MMFTSQYFNHIIFLSRDVYMAFTRYHDEPCRMEKQLQELTGPGRYVLNVPGQGESPCFMEDPHIRMEKWGANLMKNSINLESDLRGLTRKNNRDIVDQNRHTTRSAKGKKLSFPVSAACTDQSRATHPAWMFKDLEQTKWDYTHLDPRENTCLPFQNNLSTRMLERDHFVPKYPNVSN